MARKKKSYAVHLMATGANQETKCGKRFKDIRSPEDFTAIPSAVTCFLCKPKPQNKGT